MLTAANQVLAKAGIEQRATVEQRRESNSKSREYGTVDPRQNSADSLSAVFKGKVIYAQNQQPIPGVSIRLKGHEIRTATNEDGKFELVIPAGFLKEKNTFIASFIGFETKAIEVNINDFPIEKNITLSQDPALDEVVFVGTYTVHNRKWWQFWQKKSCK